MTATARHARHGAVTVAARQAMTMAGPCEPGDVLGVVEGDFAVVGERPVRGRHRRPRPAARRWRRAGHPRRRAPTADGAAPTPLRARYVEEQAPRLSTSWCTTGARSATRCSWPSSEAGARDQPRLAGRDGARRPAGQAQEDRRGPRPAHGRRPARATSRAATSRPASSPRVDELERGRDAHAWSARSSRSEVHTYQRPPHRPAGVPPRVPCCDRRPGAADVVLRQATAHRRAGTPRRSRVGRRGIFLGKVEQLPRPVAADQPADGAVRRPATSDADGDARWTRSRRCYPIYPLDQGRRLLGPPAGGRASRSTVLDDVPDPLPGRGPRRVRPARRRAPRSTGSTRPTTTAQVGGAQRRLPVRGGAGHPAGARPAPAELRALGAPGRARAAGRAARRVRRAAAVRADRGPARGRRRDRARPRRSRTR